ncbi:hypothetical protein [Streptomyces sp. NPDC059063]|uniref:hypothetical protein n=1 Tax=unclassified Streptomyces TaxID=2593676 RepID=UPI00367FEB03
MKRSGPLFTLFGGLLLALFMLTLNATNGSGSSSYGDSAPGTVKPAPTPTTSAPRATPSPSPSPSRKPKPPPDAKYTGRTDDDTASVAITLNDGKAVAYYCDGRTTESWLKGDVKDDGSMRLTGKGGAKLDGRLSGNRIRGTVDIREKTSDFTAARSAKPSGLYRATTQVRGAKLDAGWIVQADGSQVGILNRDGRPRKAPRLDPRTRTAVLDDGGRLTARPVVP